MLHWNSSNTKRRATKAIKLAFHKIKLNNVNFSSVISLTFLFHFRARCMNGIEGKTLSHSVSCVFVTDKNGFNFIALFFLFSRFTLLFFFLFPDEFWHSHHSLPFIVSASNQIDSLFSTYKRTTAYMRSESAYMCKAITISFSLRKKMRQNAKKLFIFIIILLLLIWHTFCAQHKTRSRALAWMCKYSTKQSWLFAVVTQFRFAALTENGKACKLVTL